MIHREVRALGQAEMTKRSQVSHLESELWELAGQAQYGYKIIEGNAAGDPYLLRVYLTPDRKELRHQLESMGIASELVIKAATLSRPYLHYFFRGDEDREVHNHPWRFSASLILSGGYKEYRWNKKAQEFNIKHLRPGSLNFIHRDDFHRVELYGSQGCWTLFTSFGRVMESNGQDWHFLNTTSGEYIPWGEWVHRDSSDSSRS